MKWFIFLLLGFLLMFNVSANHDDIDIVFNDVIVQEEFYVYYNSTLHTDENVGIGIEYPNGTSFIILNVTDSNTKNINQRVKVQLNTTDTYYMYSFFTTLPSGVTTIQYIDEITPSHALPNSLTIALMILTVIVLIMAVVFTPTLFLLAIIGLISVIISLMYTYSYILSPILIGVVSIAFIMLLVLVERIFRELF